MNFLFITQKSMKNIYSLKNLVYAVYKNIKTIIKCDKQQNADNSTLQTHVAFVYSEISPPIKY